MFTACFAILFKMNWFYLVLAGVFVVSIANVLEKVLMRDDKSDPIAYTIFFCFILGVLNGIAALFHGFSIPAFSISFIYLLVASILWSVGTVLVFKSLQLLESSEVTIVTSLRAIITIVASIFLLNESFNVQKTIGTVLILASVILVASLKKGFRFNNGLLLALVSTLFTGLAVVFDAFNVKSFDPISYLVIENFLMALVLILIYPKTVRQISVFRNIHFLKNMMTLSFFSFLQAILYFYALSIGPASQIAPINQAQVIVTVLVAALLLRERDHLVPKILAAFLVMIGVILLH